MKKQVRKYLILLSIALILFPSLSFAVLGTGLFDYFNAALQGVRGATDPLIATVRDFIFFYAVGLIVLVTSGSLLQHVIAHPQWLTLKNSAFVLNGFDFVHGITEMLIILVLVYLALLLILRIGDIQTKKAIVKLIIVAILLNFILPFMGIFIDISNAFYSTILERFTTVTKKDAAGNDVPLTDELGRHKSLLQLSIEKLIGNIWLQLGSMIAWLMMNAAKFLIPFASPFIHFAIIAGFNVFFLPNIVVWIFQLICAFLLSAIFFTLTILFIVRIYIIQILAVLAPLAVLCSVLPQTEKWWKEWLTHFFQWIFMGILVLFLLVLGLRFAEFIAPSVNLQVLAPGVAWFTFVDFGYFVYYSFLFIYFVLVLFVTKNTTPMLAGFVVTTGTAILAGWSTKWGLQGRRFLKALDREKGEELKRFPRVQKWANRLSQYQPQSGIARGVNTIIPFSYAVRGFGRFLGPGVAEAAKKEILKGRQAIKEIEDPELARSKFLDDIKAGKTEEAIGDLAEALTKGKKFRQAFSTIDQQQVIQLISRANQIGATKEAETIARGFIDVVRQRGGEMGFTLSEDDNKKYKDFDGNERLIAKLIAEAKGEEVKTINWDDKKNLEIIQKFWTGPQLAKAADEFGVGFVNKYMKVVNDMRPEEFVRVNPQAALYLAGNAAQDLGFSSPGGLTRAQIREIIDRMRIVTP